MFMFFELTSGDFSSMMSSCRYSNVVESVKKVKKKVGFIRTKDNNGKCALPDNSPPVTVEAKGTKSQFQRREMLNFLDDNLVSIRDTKLQCRKEGLPSLNKQKRAVLAGEVNPQASKVRTPCSTKNSKSVINSSQLKSNAAPNVSAKLSKNPIKLINRVGYYSNPSFVDDSNVLNCEISEQELLDLNLLPNGFLLHKLTMTPVATPKKYERPTGGGFYSFDGSRLSPIEEASLILSSPNGDACPCFNPDKGGETCQVVKLDFESELVDEKPKLNEMDRTLKLEMELLKVKRKIKELEWLLQRSLRRTDMLLPKLAKEDVLIAY
ncbi:hypothetical protein SUGI_0367550 [Cryptomeria japonica]|uniref:uncharacterized protein LOC131032037 n=1 Tax=Cryptomeria japonica TaxID=3369 RepID=UPI002408C5D9|nr:uncharacterized protein LOC131032037 [Cryptomeria japonica]GLJ20248.1 hypothetical protein SUGI_0367550 [Cryptomeria japonica]